MEFNKLYYFYVVAKHEHVTRAAEELLVAQPSLTKCIKQLEEELDVPLFVKQGRNIRLTPYGKLLQRRLEPIFPVLQKLPEEMRQLKGENAHLVRLNVLAASPTVSRAMIAFQKTHPEATFRFMQEKEGNGCDISIYADEGVGEREEASICVISEEIFLAVPKNSPFAARREVELAEVREEGFVFLSGFRSFRALCDLFCAKAGFQPRILFESDSPDVMRNMVKANMGMAFWPAFSWGRVSKGGDILLLPIRSPHCHRRVLIELHEGETLSQTAKDFYAFLIDYIHEERA